MTDPVVIVVGGDPQAVAETTRSVADATDTELTILDSETGVAEATTDSRDVVVIAAGTLVGPDWLAALREAAYSETTVATATALVLTDRDLSALGREFDETAQRVQAGALGLVPRVPGCAGPCTYVRRTTLELVGSEGLLEGARDDFSRRCLHHGLVHVAADRLVVLANGSPPGDTRIGIEAAPLRGSHYAAYSHEPLERALSAARRSLLGLSVTIDARCLAEPTTGTQVHVLEVIGTLVRATGVRLRIILPERLHPDAARVVEGVPPTVERLRLETNGPRVRSDIAHRPYQVSSISDLQELRRFGDRVVITQQDLIGYGNASYFSSDDAWKRYRSLTRAALASADRVVFFSDYVAREAIAEGLVQPLEARVVRLGTDHAGEDAARPAALDSDDYIVCIGTDFVHKNRVFALAVCSELARRHEWTGLLVFAGSRVGAGSSAGAEAAFLSAHAELDGRVVDLGPVTDGERRWLLEHAQLVLFPSVVEGFGLVPFEAARAGTPCAFASQGALAETLPEDAALIVPWDAAATAERVARALAVEAVAAEVVEAILQAADELTWDKAARGLTAVYADTASAPAFARDEVSFASSPTLAMVEPLMPPDVQRAFAAVVVRPRARAVVFRALLAAQWVRQSLRGLMLRR